MSAFLKTRAAGLGLLVVALSACGSDSDKLQSAGAAKSIATALASPLRKDKPQGPLGLTRAALANIVTPVDLVTVEKSGAQGVIAKIASNNGVETWSSVDNKTLALRNRVLVATRGLGGDLMTAAVPSPAQLSGGQSFVRVHTVLDGQDQPVSTRFTCESVNLGPETIQFVEYSYATRHVRESCTSNSASFTNDYWFNIGGKLRQSRQYVSESVGYVVIQHLLD